MIGKLDGTKMILPESPVDGADNDLRITNMSTDESLNGVMEVMMQRRHRMKYFLIGTDEKNRIPYNINKNRAVNVRTLEEAALA